MKPFIRRLSSFAAAIALFQATAATALAGCDRDHEAATAATIAPEEAQPANPAGAAHLDCTQAGATTGGTSHDEECQGSCDAMIGCTTLAFVAPLPGLDVPDESSPVPPLTTTYRNRSLAPESPPPKA